MGRICSLVVHVGSLYEMKRIASIGNHRGDEKSVSTQGLKQVPDFIFDLVRRNRRLADFVSQKLAIPFPQPMQRDSNGFRGHLQAICHRDQSFIRRLPRKVLGKCFKQLALSGSNIFLTQTGQYSIKDCQGPATFENGFRRGLPRQLMRQLSLTVLIIQRLQDNQAAADYRRLAILFVADIMLRGRQQKRAEATKIRAEIREGITRQKSGKEALSPVLGFVNIASLSSHETIHRQPVRLT